MIDIFVCLGLCDIRSKENCYLNYASNTKKHNFASNTITVLYKHIQYHLCYINLACRKRNGYATERVQKVKSPERCVYWNRKKNYGHGKEVQVQVPLERIGQNQLYFKMGGLKFGIPCYLEIVLSGHSYTIIDGQCVRKHMN